MRQGRLVVAYEKLRFGVLLDHHAAFPLLRRLDRSDARRQIAFRQRTEIPLHQQNSVLNVYVADDSSHGVAWRVVVAIERARVARDIASYVRRPADNRALVRMREKRRGKKRFVQRAKRVALNA